MSNQQEVLQSFQSTLEQESAVVALVQNRVVALATFIPGVNLELLQGNFDLGSRIEMGEIAEETHAEVDMIVINPIFAHRKYDLLMNCLLSLPASVLFYALPPGTEKPEVLAAFAQASSCPRARILPFAAAFLSGGVRHVAGVS